MLETFRGVVFPWLCDQQGHLTTSQFMLMFDQASYHLMDAIERGADEPDHLSWADVRHEIDYRQEVSAGMLVLVTSSVVRVGTKSLGHRHVMRSTDRATVYAEMTATTVRFDKQQRAGAVLSENLRARASDLIGA